MGSLLPFTLWDYANFGEGAIRYINLPQKNLWFPASCGQPSDQLLNECINIDDMLEAYGWDIRPPLAIG